MDRKITQYNSPLSIKELLNPMKVQVDFYSETSEDIYGTIQAKIKYPIVSWNGYK